MPTWGEWPVSAAMRAQPFPKSLNDIPSDAAIICLRAGLARANGVLSHLGNRWLLGLTLVACLSVIFIPASAQVAVSDTTGWTAWALPDVNADQQTGSGYDDLVGDVTTPMIQQKTGTLNGANVVLYRVRLRVFSAENDWANGGNLGLGMDLDGNNTVDLIGMVEQSSNATTLNFTWGTPGMNANTSPSTTDYTPIVASATDFTTYTSGTPNPTTATWWYTPTTDAVDFGGEGGGASGNDAWMTFAISYASFNTAIDNYTSAAFKASAFGMNLDFDASTQINTVVFTSQQSNAFNQDIGGVDGYVAATTFESMNAFVSVSADGTPAPVPEPSTYAQLGVLLMAGLGLKLRRRRRDVVPVNSRPKA